MVTSLVGLALFAYALILLTVSVSVWLYVVSRLKTGQPILPQRAIPVSQRGATNIAMIVIGALLALMLFLNTVAVIAQYADGPEAVKPSLDSRSIAIWAQMIIQSLICLLLAGTILMRGGKDIFFGKTESQFLQDAKVGLLAFCALCVPVVLIQILASKLTPYEHPLIDMMIKDPQWSVLVPVLISAVLIAPVTEEFSFRLVLQGWLEDHLNPPPQIDAFPANEHEEIVTPLGEEDLFSLETAPNPYASPPQSAEAFTQVAEPTYTPPFQLAPIMISASLFALMHLGQGAAPIPLFFLALGLGYVFQKTRTMTASLVIHFMLNGQSMLLLLVQMFFGDMTDTPPV